MYEQIAKNKRRAAVCVILFFVVWVGIGALLGFLWAELSRPSSGPSPGVGGDITVGIVVAAVLALAGIGFSFTSGRRLVLSVSGATRLTPANTANCMTSSKP